jgi:hypothetical protein
LVNTNRLLASVHVVSRDGHKRMAAEDFSMNPIMIPASVEVVKHSDVSRRY